MKKRIADIVIECLVKNGITDCFSVVGGGAMHLNNAFALNKVEDISEPIANTSKGSAMIKPLITVLRFFFNFKLTLALLLVFLSDMIFIIIDDAK